MQTENTMTAMRDTAFVCQCRLCALKNPHMRTLSQVVTYVRLNSKTGFFIEPEYAAQMFHSMHRKYEHLAPEEIPATTQRQRMWADFYVRTRRIYLAGRYNTLWKAITKVLTSTDAPFYIAQSTGMRIAKPFANKILNN